MDPVRFRLALWHTVSLAVLLLGFAAASFLYVSRSSYTRIDDQLRESMNAYRSDAMSEPGEDAREDHINEAAADFQSPTQIVVFEPNGTVRAASRADPNDRGPTLQQVADIVRHSPVGRQSVMTIPDSLGGHRIMILPARIGSELFLLVGVRSMHERRQDLRSLLLTFGLTIPLALMLAGLVGYWLAGRSLRPVVRMTEQQRRFMADAAHELRTPVAILRAESDVALSKPNRSPHEYRESLQLLRDESVRLSGIVEDLFLIARVDAGQVPLRKQPIRLDELVNECVRAVKSLAGAREIVTTTSPQSQPVYADEALLRRLILILLDNAIKYSPPDAHITLTIRSVGGSCSLAVRSDGLPIDPAIRARIFERFYRGVESQKAPLAGAGLGLAIAKWITQAHGGQLSLSDGIHDGNEFVVTLKEKSNE